jgi:hypothetical protein
MTSHDPHINCYCNFCGSPLRFQISRVGQVVNCFNCSMETVLFIPGLSAPYPEDQYLLQVREVVWGDTQFGGRQIGGVVVNSSAKNLDWVRVEFILYNQAGLPIGSTSDCLITLASQAVWKFAVPVHQPEAVRASEPLLSCEYGRISRNPPQTPPPNPSFVSSSANKNG